MNRSGKLSERPTSFDIAFRAGVSQPTVSRALRGSKQVSEDTRRKVLEIARDLNYRVDKNASNLRFQHTNTLALLFFEDAIHEDSLINPFFLPMLGSITRACAKRGYDLLISHQNREAADRLEFEDSGKADGIILLGYGDYHEARVRLAKLESQGTHFVRWGQVHSEGHGISVGCDNFQGGVLAADHLLALGRQRIGFVGHASSRYPEFEQRFLGCVTAMANAGVTFDARRQIDAISTESAGYEAVHELVRRGIDFDALFCGSDLIALGAMKALRENGRDIPTDVSVVGFDDIPAANLAHPPLTTVMQDTRLAGERLVDILVRLIRGETADSQVLPARLVVRRSCGAMSLAQA